MAALGALAGGQPVFLGCLPETVGIIVHCNVKLLARQQQRRTVLDGFAHGQALLRIRLETGMDAGPPLARANSQSFTWLMAVPRTCSTASTMCVMPMM